VAESPELIETFNTVTDDQGNQTTETIFVEGDRLITHEYSVTNFSLGGTYDIQLPFVVRPYVGTSIDFVGSKRTPRYVRVWDEANSTWGGQSRVIAEKEEPGWSMTGSTAVVGLRWLITDSWSMHIEGKYLFPYTGELPPLSTVGLGVKYIL
jgi:hypothetical protein